MATIGAERLLSTYGSPLGVAEALLEGRLNSYDQQYFVGEIVSKLMLEAARIRIEWKRAQEKQRAEDKPAASLSPEVQEAKQQT